MGCQDLLNVISKSLVVLLIWNYFRISNIVCIQPIVVVRGPWKDYTTKLYVTEGVCTFSLDRTYRASDWKMTITTHAPTISLLIWKMEEVEKVENTYFLQSLYKNGPGDIEVLFQLHHTPSTQFAGECDSNVNATTNIQVSSEQMVTKIVYQSDSPGMPNLDQENVVTAKTETEIYMLQNKPTVLSINTDKTSTGTEFRTHADDAITISLPIRDQPIKSETSALNTMTTLSNTDIPSKNNFNTTTTYASRIIEKVTGKTSTSENSLLYTILSSQDSVTPTIVDQYDITNSMHVSNSPEKENLTIMTSLTSSTHENELRLLDKDKLTTYFSSQKTNRASISLKDRTKGQTIPTTTVSDKSDTLTYSGESSVASTYDDTTSKKQNELTTERVITSNNIAFFASSQLDIGISDMTTKRDHGVSTNIDMLPSEKELVDELMTISDRLTNSNTDAKILTDSTVADFTSGRTSEIKNKITENKPDIRKVTNTYMTNDQSDFSTYFRSSDIGKKSSGFDPTHPTSISQKAIRKPTTDSTHGYLPNTGKQERTDSFNLLTTEMKQNEHSTPCFEVCHCVYERNLTTEEVLQKVENLVNELTINKKETTAAKNKKISASDQRPSSKAFGFVGIMVLCSLSGLIILADLEKMIQIFKKRLKRGIRVLKLKTNSK